MTEERLWTIGHSTRPIQEFLSLLARHGVRQLVDVRAIPFSGRNPQFNQDALSDSLATAGLVYRHIGALGGRRKSRSDSKNVGWRNASFRGYADYMQTPGFQQGLQELIDVAQGVPTAIMLAEPVYGLQDHRDRDDLSFLVAFAWKIQKGQSDQHRQQPLPRKYQHGDACQNKQHPQEILDTES